MTRPLAVVVHGTPAPQGSKRHVGNGVMVESSVKVGPWREAVRHATELAMAVHGGWAPQREPLYLDLVVTLARPRSHYGTGRHAERLKVAAPARPITTPDLDKLIRSTLDGLADGGAFLNDSLVAEIYALKCYPGGHLDALDTPGAAITLHREGP